MMPAVFAKNHRKHLLEAAKTASANPAQLVTFRSSRRWAEATRLLEQLGPGALPVLFAVVDQGPKICYRAMLQEVVLEPTPDDPRTKELLLLRTDSTRNEDTWADNPKSLYVISGCHKLKRSIPYSALRKLSDDKPLSEEFNYSYALVKLADREDDGIAPGQIASDVTPPPARFQSVVSRVVRDSALVRQLKTLHNHRCQRCSMRLELPSGNAYSEAHHLQPLGRPYNGPDDATNIIIVCPNCHAFCDLRAIKLDRDALTTVEGHAIGDEFLQYHNSLVDRQTTELSRGSRKSGAKTN